MAWQKLYSFTLTGATATQDTSTITSKKFLQILAHHLGLSGSGNSGFQFNGDTGTVYTFRYSNDGAADATNTSDTQIQSQINADTLPRFIVGYGINISGEEKLFITFNVGQNTAGATNPPKRDEVVGKFVPSPDADITRIVHKNSDTNFLTGANLSALGTD